MSGPRGSDCEGPPNPDDTENPTEASRDERSETAQDGCAGEPIRGAGKHGEIVGAEEIPDQPSSCSWEPSDAPVGRVLPFFKILRLSGPFGLGVEDVRRARSDALAAVAFVSGPVPCGP